MMMQSLWSLLEPLLASLHIIIPSHVISFTTTLASALCLQLPTLEKVCALTLDWTTS